MDDSTPPPDTSNRCATCGSPRLPGGMCPVCVLSLADEHAATSDVAPEIPRYHLLKIIGQGGMGVVWLAEQEGTKQQVAVKLLKYREASREDAVVQRARFAREIEMAARLRHANIARVYDGDVTDDACYYAMEFVDGVPLDKFVEQRSLSRRGIIELMRKVCDAVQHAHQNGIIHRDLKPSNILVGADGEPKVLDFGLAKVLDAAVDTLLATSSPGQLLGTPHYMSPEQAAGEPADTRTDVFSLGVLFYRLLTGKLPHQPTASLELFVHRVLAGEIIRPREAQPDLDAGLEILLLKSLSRQPAARYRNAGELADELERFLTDRPLAAGRGIQSYLVKTWFRRHARGVIIGTAAAALSVLGGAYYVISLTKSEGEARKATERALRFSAERDAAGGALRRRLTESAAYLFEDAEALLDDHVAREGFHGLVSSLASDPKSQAPAFSVAEALLRGNLPSLPLFTLTGVGKIRNIEFSHDGRFLLTSDEAGEIRFWDATTGEAYGNDKHTGFVPHGIAMSPSGRPLAASTSDGRAMVWDTVRGGEPKVAAYPAFSWPVWLSPDERWLLSASVSGEAQLFDLTASRMVRSFSTSPPPPPGEHHYVKAAFSDDGRWLALGGGLQPVELWKLGSEIKLVGKFPITAALQALAFRPDGKALVCITRGSRVWMMRLRDGASSVQEMQLPAELYDGNCVTFSPDSRSLVIGTVGGNVEVFDAESLQRKESAISHRIMVCAVVFRPDGRQLATTSDDGMVRLWTFPEGRPMGVPIRVPNGRTDEIRYHPNGQTLAVLAGDGRVFVFETTRATRGGISLWHPCPIWSAAFSLDDSLLATGGRDQKVRLWNARTGKVVGEFVAATHEIIRLRFQPGSTRLAMGSWAGEVEIFDTRKPDAMQRIATGNPIKHDGHVNALSFTLDGSLLAASSDEGSIRVWQTENGAPAAEPAYVSSPRKWPAFGVAFGPDNGRYVAAYQDGSVRMWETPANRYSEKMMLHPLDVRGLDASRDGRWVATACTDGYARLWRSGTAQLVHEWPHFSPVVCATFNTGSSVVATGAQDGTVRMQLVGEPMTRIVPSHRHQHQVRDVSFSNDGKWLVSSSWDESVRVRRVILPRETPAEVASILAQLVPPTANDTPANRKALRRLVDGLPQAGPAAEWRELLAWYLAPRVARSVAPGSGIMVSDWARELAALGIPKAASEAAEILPQSQAR